MVLLTAPGPVDRAGLLRRRVACRRRARAPWSASGRTRWGAV